MVGVVHSSSAIDAIQRFIGRIELGMLPSIIDTIVFIEGGDISMVLIIKMTVKVPHGFRDKDLARPVVEVRDFKTDRLAYEIYSFGQDIVINPINPTGHKSAFQTKEQYRIDQFSRRRREKKKIDLDVEITKQKVILKADPEYASNNIIVFADNQEIFTGSLSRSGIINLSLSNKEGRRVLKEYDRNKKFYGIIK
jgi:ATPase